MDSEIKSDAGLFKGLILGGIIGVVLGVIFAPLTGEDTRERLKRKLEEFDLDELSGKFAEAFDAGKDEAIKQIKEGE